MLRLGIAFLLLAAVAAASTEEGYEGFKLFEVVPKTQQQSDFLHDLAQNDELYDFFVLRRIPNEPAHVMVHRHEIPNFLKKLDLRKISFKVLDDDVGRSAKKSFKWNMLRRGLKSGNEQGRLSTDRYYNHTEINNYIEYLAARYPTRVFVTQVGKSYLGRDLKTITISNGNGRTNKKVIFMDAGIHAREWISPSTLLYVMEQLVENFKENEDLLKDYDFIMLPIVNPDGYEYTQISASTRYWRKTRQPYKYRATTCYGSDANRNFDCHWNEGGASAFPCSDTYAGPHPFSEPETVALRDLINSLKGRGIFYLTFHSYGNYLLYPWGWTYDPPEAVDDFEEIAKVGAEAMRNATGVQYKIGTTPAVLYIASGASQDYAYASGFNVSITMELPGTGGGYYGFAPPPSAIHGMVTEAWIGVRAMCKRVIDKYGA